jgi:hypothetical protein
MTTTLLARIASLRGEVERHAALTKAYKAAAGIRARTEELKEEREGVILAMAKLDVLRDGTGASVGGVNVEAVLQTAGVYVERLKSSAADSGKEHNKFRRSVEKVHKDLDKMLEKRLAEIEKSIPSIDETYLRQVEQIPGYAEKVKAVRAARQKLLSGVSLSEMGPSQLTEFLERRETVKTLSDSLSPAEFPEEVRDFFVAMRRDAATLDKLTETVRQWLADRDLLKHLRLRVVTER